MRRWTGLVAALLGVLLMIAIIFGLARGLLGIMNVVKDPGAPDEMYDQHPAEVAATRPPELAEAEDAAYTPPEDMSANWVYDELNPVEMTAEELAGTAGNN